MMYLKYEALDMFSVKGWISHINSLHKKVSVALLMPHKVDFRTRSIISVSYFIIRINKMAKLL
jgi:hypothetical protein